VSDEDDVDDLLDALKSDDDESAGAERSDSDNDSDMDNSDLEDSSSVTEAEENMMSDDDDSMGDDGASMITQAEVYDNLKRIGELEDEKQKIQDATRAHRATAFDAEAHRPRQHSLQDAPIGAPRACAKSRCSCKPDEEVGA
jgi:hypothetical protein